MVSCQASNADPSVQTIVEYMDVQLSVSLDLVHNLPWQQRLQAFKDGDIEIAWICGSYYVDLMKFQPSQFRLLVAPVMQGKRYQNKPVYFSDIIVRTDSLFHSFSDLRNKSWAYNEPGSYSGPLITRYHLAELGLTHDFFGGCIESGSHQTSLQMVLAGKIDATTIDSTVLEEELRLYPELGEKIRVIESIGPSPIPPWVLRTSLSPNLQTQLREIMLHMHEDEAGRQALAAGDIARFACVQDSDYDVIRSRIQMAEKSGYLSPTNLSRDR
jgi:phosphonate transport system substrate-binding protein